MFLSLWIQGEVILNFKQQTSSKPRLNYILPLHCLFQGVNCEIKYNECENINCHNGTCINLETTSFHCNCNVGYEGKFCEIDIDDCNSNPCQGEDSFCYDKVNDYECKCQTGLTGRNCETNIDECDPNPCKYGLCVDKIGDYECSCNPGYTGRNCSTVSVKFTIILN